MTNPIGLSAYDSKRLSRCEQTIESGMLNFLDVVWALIEIRDHELYKSQWNTFEDYIAKRWGMRMTHEGQFLENRILKRIVASVLDLPDMKPESDRGIPCTDADALHRTLGAIRNLKEKDWPDAKLANLCCVSEDFVNRLRYAISTGNSIWPTEPPGFWEEGH